MLVAVPDDGIILPSRAAPEQMTYWSAARNFSVSSQSMSGRETVSVTQKGHTFPISIK